MDATVPNTPVLRRFSAGVCAGCPVLNAAADRPAGALGCGAASHATIHTTIGGRQSVCRGA